MPWRFSEPGKKAIFFPGLMMRNFEDCEVGHGLCVTLLRAPVLARTSPDPDRPFLAFRGGFVPGRDLRMGSLRQFRPIAPAIRSVLRLPNGRAA